MWILHVQYSVIHVLTYARVLAFPHQCTQAYLMSVVMVVNEKWRERVPAWGAFETLPDNFPIFFQRLLDACLAPLEVHIHTHVYIVHVHNVILFNVIPLSSFLSNLFPGSNNSR